MISSAQKNIIIDILSDHKPRMVGIFGSYARGENDEKSDLDILVDFVEPLDLLEIIGLEQQLTERLGIKVDLITLHSLSSHLKHYVEKDLISIKG
jgi:predicted nucleotidyltransferase